LCLLLSHLLSLLLSLLLHDQQQQGVLKEALPAQSQPWAAMEAGAAPVGRAEHA
jgi:hypothetical protein